jgi:phospholipase C
MRKFSVLAAALILAALPTVTAAAAPVEDISTTTPIKHVVWMMQDNHSFDNYFGTYPGADGIRSGVCQRVSLNRPSTRGCVQPFHIGDTPVEDLSQGPGVQRRQYNGGRMDGFVAAYRRLGQDGTTAMGYYDGTDLPFHWNVADQYVLFDRFFASTRVGAREPYLYWVAGNAPAGETPLRNSAGYDSVTTIFDRLAEHDISAKFYVENLDTAATSGRSDSARSQMVKVPLLSMKRFHDSGELAGRVVDLNEYYLDLRNGTLPAVSYIVTTRSSENPPAGPEAGSRAVRKVTSELMKSSAWSNSALMWTYDGWGGWYDHVPPPRVDGRGYGFRVPALLVSPYAKRGVVDHTVLDYTAMLHFIESNWKLAPLSTRDKQSAGLASAFDFSAAPRTATLLPWTWPAPQAALSTNNPAPVIYSVYGVAAALAIAMVSVAALRRGPIRVPVPVARVAVLVRSRLESMRDRLDRFLWGSRYSPTPAASLAAPSYRGDGPERPGRSSDPGPAILTVPRWPRPTDATNGEAGWAEWYQTTQPTVTGIPEGQAAASVTAHAVNGDHANQSGAVPEPSTTGGQVSVQQPGAKADAELETQAAAADQPAIAPNADTPTQATAEPGAQAELAAAAEAEACPHCGAEVAAQEMFCEDCGGTLTPPAGADLASATEVTTATGVAIAPHWHPSQRRNPNRRHRRHAKAKLKPKRRQ